MWITEEEKMDVTVGKKERNKIQTILVGRPEGGA
jgi:hypothetical protein